ncbi:MAG: glycosyltransferase family 4 protein [Actinomycetota bacterium]
MRVLYVTDFYAPYTGGVEIHVRTIAHEMAARGHEVAVATLGTPDGEAERTSDGPVTVFTVGHAAERIGVGFTHQHRPWAPPFADPVAMVGLRRVVQRFAPDVIHGHDWLARSVQPRVVSGRVPVVTSLHYYTLTCAKKTLWRNGAACDGPSLSACLGCARDHYGSVKGPAVTAGLRIGARMERRRSSRFVSVSAATAAGNGLDGDDRSVVIANPVAPAALESAAATDDEVTLPPELPAGPFVLYVGDLRPEKGLRVLLDAVAQLRQRGDDTPLVLAGERMADHGSVPAHTVELGAVDHEVVQALWRRATVGVIPSMWPEPFGLVAVEAMAAGCPVVASDTGGLSEILADGRARLVPVGDVEGFATAIADLLTDTAARDRQAAAARCAVESYLPARIVDALEAEYRQAVAL